MGYSWTKAIELQHREGNLSLDVHFANPRLDYSLLQLFMAHYKVLKAVRGVCFQT